LTDLYVDGIKVRIEGGDEVPTGRVEVLDHYVVAVSCSRACKSYLTVGCAERILGNAACIGKVAALVL
jgi:hypothetical protein